MRSVISHQRLPGIVDCTADATAEAAPVIAVPMRCVIAENVPPIPFAAGGGGGSILGSSGTGSPRATAISRMNAGNALFMTSVGLVLAVVDR